eukprot:TRINITY_DN3591_c0_g1_i5.p1 TRINITY_DN3591_c0_g1~~TRINITY_DN3591_c0_g1_i5.p1  ORF type:complete len:214 (-),score=6.65 TRINITY_DN3591_c0_g1_i5:106-747(-)
MKSVIITIISRALRHEARERLEMEDILSSMRKLREAESIKYKQVKFLANRSITNVLMLNNSERRVIELGCGHLALKDCLVGYALEDFLDQRQYKYTCKCAVCKGTMKLKSLPLDCGCVWTTFGKKMDARVRTSVDIKCFKEQVKIESDSVIEYAEDRYIYQVSHKNVAYILKGYRIPLSFIHPVEESKKVMKDCMQYFTGTFLCKQCVPLILT